MACIDVRAVKHGPGKAGSVASSTATHTPLALVAANQ